MIELLMSKFYRRPFSYLMLKEVSCFLLDKGLIYYLFDFWLNIEVFRTVKVDGLLTKEESQGNDFHHPQMQVTLAFAENTFFGQDCKQYTALVTSQKENAEESDSRKSALVRINQKNKQNSGCFIWAVGVNLREEHDGKGDWGRLKHPCRK